MNYKNDPRKISVKWAVHCNKCFEMLKNGNEAFYWPATKTILCTKCGADEYSNFLLYKEDEDFLMQK